MIYHTDMLQKMFLDNTELHLTEKHLPCLISYEEKTGGSQFSVTLIADLFMRGSKVLFLTAYPMATENFLKQASGTTHTIQRIEKEEDITSPSTADMILIKSGDEKLFLKVFSKLPDINQRIIFVKNMEVFSSETIDKVLPLKKLIVSGHLDECELKEKIASKQYASTIFFSQPQTGKFHVPTLEKYTGYLKAQDIEGVVSLDMK